VSAEKESMFEKDKTTRQREREKRKKERKKERKEPEGRSVKSSPAPG
jgi:hypothetical protein